MSGDTVLLLKNVDIRKIREEYDTNLNLMVIPPMYFPGHTDSTSVDLRSPKIKNRKYSLSEYNEKIVRHQLITVDRQHAKMYPVLMDYLLSLSRERNGFLSRVLLGSIKNEIPGKDYSHIDTGYFYIFHDRYHLVLYSKGSTMTSGSVTHDFVTGDFFYINNKIKHNGGHSLPNEERIHVFFDVLPRNILKIIRMYFIWFFNYDAQGKHTHSLWGKLYGIKYLMQAIYISLFTYRAHSDW